jgi:hypothetical protein
MWLLEDKHAGKLVKANNESTILIKGPLVTAGLAFVIFNPGDTTTAIISTVEKTYKAASKKLQFNFDIKPNGIANVLYVAENMVIISGDIE